MSYYISKKFGFLAILLTIRLSSVFAECNQCVVQDDNNTCENPNLTIKDISATMGSQEGQIILNWAKKEISQGTHYLEITYSSNENNSDNAPIYIDIEEGKKEINELDPGKFYEFTFTTIFCSDCCRSSEHSIMKMTPDAPPPPVQDVKTMGGTEEGEVKLSWTNPKIPGLSNSDLDYIEIGWTLNGGILTEDGEPQPIQVFADINKNEESCTLSKTSPVIGTCTISKLTPGSIYAFTLVSVDNNGNRSVGITIPGKATDEKPDPVSINSITGGINDGEVVLHWTNPDIIDLQRIEIRWVLEKIEGNSSTTDGPDQPIAVITTEPNKEKIHTISGLKPGETYQFTLVSVDNNGQRSDEETETETATDLLPPNVSNFEAIGGIKEGTVTLSWTNPDIPDLRHIEIKRNGSNDEFVKDNEPDFCTISGAHPGEVTCIIDGLTPGIEYTFTLVSVDNKGKRSDKATENGTTPATATATAIDLPPIDVTNFEAMEDTEEGRVTLSWTNPDVTDLKHVEISLTPLSDGASIFGVSSQPIQVVKDGMPDFCTISEESPGKITCTISELTPGKIYAVTLVNVDNNDNRSAGITITGTAKDEKPKPVSGVMTSGGANDGEVVLKWTNPGIVDLSHIEIRWVPEGDILILDGPEQPIEVITTESEKMETHTISGLTPGKKYTFTMVSVDNNGQRSDEETENGTSPDPVTATDLPPPDVSNFEAIGGIKEGEVKLNWTNPNVPDLRHIEIERVLNDSPNSSMKVSVDSNGAVSDGNNSNVRCDISNTQPEQLTCIIDGLIPGEEYTFTVVSIDDNNNRFTGVTRKATATDLPPPDVTNVKAMEGDKEGTVKLSWTNPDITDLKHVEISLTPLNDGASISGVSSQPIQVVKDNMPAFCNISNSQAQPKEVTCTISELTPGKIYAFTLVSVDNNDNISAGITRLGTAKDDDPGPVSIGRITGGANEGEVDLHWINPPDIVDLKHIEITWTPDDPAQPITVITTKSEKPETQTISGLMPGETYAFTLVSVDNNGNRSAEASASATATNLPPDMVSNARATMGRNEGQVDLHWINPNNNGFAYTKIVTRKGSSEHGTTRTSGMEEHHTISGLKPGESYMFDLYSVDNTGMASPKITTDSVEATDLRPPNVSHLTASKADSVEATDLRPPNVSHLTASKDGDTIGLCWLNPDIADLKEIEIEWMPSTTGSEQNPMMVKAVNKSGKPGEMDTIPVEPEKLYIFTVTSVDNKKNRSTGVTISVATNDNSSDPSLSCPEVPQMQ